MVGAIHYIPVLIVGEKSVRNPYFFSEISRKSQGLVFLGAEGETLIFPVLVEVHCYRVVL